MTNNLGKRPVSTLVKDEILGALKSLGEGMAAHYHLDTGFDERMRESGIAIFKSENPGAVISVGETATPN